MKTITLIIMVFTIGFNGNKTKTKISSHYDCFTTINDGRCTGSAYCSACSNCSRCAHCSNGGTCGVCSGSNSNSFYSTPKTKARKRTNSTIYYKPVSEVKEYYVNEVIITHKESINLRELPNTKSKIIEKISYGKSVVFIEKTGEWSRVKVQETGSVGYVFSNLLNF